jgi:hypothetical protein
LSVELIDYEFVDWGSGSAWTMVKTFQIPAVDTIEEHQEGTESGAARKLALRQTRPVRHRAEVTNDTRHGLATDARGVQNFFESKNANHEL